MPSTRKMDLATYNSLVENLNIVGNNGIPSAASSCTEYRWNDVSLLTSPARLAKDSMEYLKAGALTLDNNLNYDTANSVDWAHEQLYSETIQATNWTPCTDINLIYLAVKDFEIVECPIVPFMCIYSPLGPLTAEYNARLACVTARNNWVTAVSTNSPNIDTYATIYNQAAVTQQALARQIYNQYTGYTNLWLYVPSNTGFTSQTRFYQTYNGSSHNREYVWTERYFFSRWFWYYLDNGEQKTFGMPSGTLWLDSSPNGTICSLSTSVSVFNYFLYTTFAPGNDPAPFPFTTDGCELNRHHANQFMD